MKIAEDGEILIKGPNIFQRLLQERRRELRRDRRRLAAHRRLGEVDEDGYVFITGRKKDIIITAGGKNLTPANLENDIKQTPLGLPGRHARRPPAVPGRC